MALPFRKFACYVLRDLSERVKTTDDDRVTLNGNQISRQFVLPVRGERETQEEFAARMVKFRSDVPRGTDQAYRLALAHEAFVRAGDNVSVAAVRVLEELKRLPGLSERDRVLWDKLGISHKPLRPKLGTTRRGHRTKRKKTGYSACYRQVEMIRSEVSRYKKKHKDFDQAFAKEFVLYRSMFGRDSEFCAAEEAMYRDLLARCETGLSLCHQLTATYTVNLARVLHEQGKFDESIPIYWLGLARSWAADLAPPYRESVTGSILRDIENCQNRQPPAFSVGAIVKRGHLRRYHVTVDLPGNEAEGTNRPACSRS
jgi:hypothetical protein